MRDDEGWTDVTHQRPKTRERDALRSPIQHGANYTEVTPGTAEASRSAAVEAPVVDAARQSAAAIAGKEACQKGGREGIKAATGTHTRR